MPRRGWLVYLLACADGSLYCGATSDLARRLAAHQAGRGARYTRSRLPVRVAWSEPARDQGAALRREAAVKRLTRREKLALVAGRGARRGARSQGRRPASDPGSRASGTRGGRGRFRSEIGPLRT